MFFGGLFKVWAVVVLLGRLVLRRDGWYGFGVVGGVAVGPPAESFLIDIWFCLTVVEDSGMPLVWLLLEICYWAFWVGFEEEFGGGFWAPLVFFVVSWLYDAAGWCSVVGGVGLLAAALGC